MLVVGAGAAGATAAIRAAQLRANAMLVEQTGGAFGVQAGSNTRWIDPVQYDWPARHWDKQMYPFCPPPLPLGFGADISSNLAIYWDTVLHQHQRALQPRLNYQPNTQVTALGPGATRQFLAALQIGRVTANLEFDLVMWAVGFGQERTSIPRRGGGLLSGPPFWSTDTLTDPNCGLVGKPARVFILGCGDGALQDFLRAATKLPSAREIYERLKIPDRFRDAAQDIEAQFHRAFVWCNGADDEARLLEARDSAYRDLVVDLWKEPNFPARACGLLRSDIKSLEVAFQTTYLTAFYGLNCLLARVIGQAWADRIGIGTPINVVLRGGWRAREGHFDPAQSVFEVTLDAQPGPPPITPTPDTRECDVLIIRIGIDPRSTVVPLAFPGKPSLVRTRHLFPYHLPG